MKEENSKKVILDLCGGTGAWSRPYAEAGYDVSLITLPEYDVAEVEYEGRWMHFQRQDVYRNDHLLIDCTEVCGILAAPPCTEFSVAKGSRPRDFESAMKVVRACLEIIWHCRIHGNMRFWAMENPRGYLRQFIGIPHYTFEQWQFGEEKIKATDIWGYFREPVPTINQKPDGMTIKMPNGRTNGRDWAKIKCPSEYEEYINHFQGDAKRAALRAITPSGFAEAFFRANR